MSASPSEGRFMRCYKGVLTDEGVECQAFRSDDNELFTLIGDLEGYGVGDQVVVCGTIAEISFCMQGTTLVISYIGKNPPKALKRSTKKASKSSP